MSHTRVSNGKGLDDWRDDGPSSAHLLSKPYSVQAANVGSMRPVVTNGGLSIDWKGKRRAFSVTGKAKDAP